jgi:hypothetical protein
MVFKLSHETGITTFAQLVTIVPLAFLNGLFVMGKSCFGDDSSSCAINSLFSMFSVLFLAGWFGFLCMLGYATQEKRSQLFARLLILGELAVVAIALFVLQNPGSILDTLSGLLAIGLAGWTILLAIRIHQAKGRRIVARPRRRARND